MTSAAELLQPILKPLFIPLRAKYFLAFQDGKKTTEYREYGPRWNENASAAAA